MKSSIWIRIKVKSRIRIRIKRVWIRNTDFWGDVLYCNITIGSENVGDVVQGVRNDVFVWNWLLDNTYGYKHFVF
jgi:hypothetical protein